MKEEKKIREKDYVKLLSSLSIKNIELIYLNAQVKKELIKKKETLIAEWYDESEILDIKKNEFSIIHRLIFNGYIKDKKFLEIEIKFRLEYKSNKRSEISKEFLESFKDTSVRLHSWPYMRELLHTLLIKMGLPPFFLPLSVISQLKDIPVK